MALPDSLVSISAAVHAGVFFRRAEQALKSSAALGCLPDIGPMSVPRFMPAAAGFRRHSGEIQLVLTLNGKAALWIFPVELVLDVYVSISADTVEDRRLTPVAVTEGGRRAGVAVVRAVGIRTPKSCRAEGLSICRACPTPA